MAGSSRRVAETVVALVLGLVLPPMVAITALGCTQDDRGKPGTERGACKADHTCEPGLWCLSDLCVRPPPADCAAVADALATIKLGNYGEPAERAKVVGELTKTCTDARLSKEEGQCILDAKGRVGVARCPRPLLPELAADKDGCQAVARHLEDVIQREMATDSSMREMFAKVAADMIEAIATSCTEDRWPDDVKTCFGALAKADDGDDCMDKLPAEAKKGFENRMEAVMSKAMSGAGSPTSPGAPPEMPKVTMPPDIDAGPVAAGTISPGCTKYLALIEAYSTCDKVPADTRKALVDAASQVKQSLATSVNTPQEALDAIDQACTQGAEGMRSAMTALGCAVPGREPPTEKPPAIEVPAEKPAP